MDRERDCPPDTLAGADDLGDAAWGELVDALIASRRSFAPRRIGHPGPDADQLARLFAAAAAAPDHNQLLPWRFVIVPADKRERLADVFAQSLLDRDAAASPQDVQLARAKAHNCPLLMLAIARFGEPDAEVSNLERMVSLGAAIQNLLLAAHGMGLAGGLAGGRALRSQHLRELFGLAPSEYPTCFVLVGTALGREPSRPRPTMDAFVSEL
jgi:nitroreductase